ncbi:MAG: stage III sporulation protein AE [Oscillospiraceae bacterium]|nr:stage III sporulation protein AE [Oscillospiraceae bacterium]
MKKWLLLALLLPFFVGTAHAEGLNEQLGEELQVRAVQEGLSGEAGEIGGELRFDGSYDAQGALARLWSSFRRSLTERLRAETSTAMKLAAVSVLCALGLSLCPEKGVREYLEIACCCAAALILSEGVGSMTEEAERALNDLTDYAGLALPAVFSAAMACGAAVSASARYAAAGFALSVMLAAGRGLILPLVNAVLALSVCCSIFDNPLLRALVKLFKKLAALLMTGLTAAFTALLSITGLVTGSADAAAVKTVKSVISASLPVVGGVLSDAAASVLAAAGVVRNTAGAFGMIAVCAICAAPFAALAVKALLLRLVSAAAELAAGQRLSGLLRDMAAVMSLLLGLLGSYGLMLFFCFVSAIRTVTA